MEREEIIAHMEQALPHTVFAPLGIRVSSYDPDRCQVAIDIDERHHQPLGLLHGGVSALLAESAASMAAALSVDMERFTVIGVDLNATHVKAKRNGTVTATHVYAVDIRDHAGDLVCVARCTVAIRPRK
jgi:1,4-dihydroxy-2-naphthoyl-CoA hydrolase